MVASLPRKSLIFVAIPPDLLKTRVIFRGEREEELGVVFQNITFGHFICPLKPRPALGWSRYFTKTCSKVVIHALVKVYKLEWLFVLSCRLTYWPTFRPTSSSFKTVIFQSSYLSLHSFVPLRVGWSRKRTFFSYKLLYLAHAHIRTVILDACKEVTNN